MHVGLSSGCLSPLNRDLSHGHSVLLIASSQAQISNIPRGPEKRNLCSDGKAAHLQQNVS